MPVTAVGLKGHRLICLDLHLPAGIVLREFHLQSAVRRDHMLLAVYIQKLNIRP